jgi:hypothetical protein
VPLNVQEQYAPAYQYQDGAHPPPLETVSSSPHLQVVAAPLPPYSTTSTEYYSAAHAAQPFSYKDTVETAGQDSGREAGADVAARVEDARGRGQLQAAIPLVHLLNMSPGYVYPQ